MPSLTKLYKISLVLDVAFQDLVCDLFSEDDSSPDSVELEIMRRLHLLSYADKKHILRYLDMFTQYLNHKE